MTMAVGIRRRCSLVNRWQREQPLVEVLQQTFLPLGLSLSLAIEAQHLRGRERFLLKLRVRIVWLNYPVTKRAHKMHGVFLEMRADDPWEISGQVILAMF
jgi:hypothetical protein